MADSRYLFKLKKPVLRNEASY